jgi:hypothetical protein
VEDPFPEWETHGVEEACEHEHAPEASPALGLG